MKLEHIAIWVKDLEVMKDFYIKYFGMISSEKYVNEKKRFSSYFLSFQGGARIELMLRQEISTWNDKGDTGLGFSHLAISVGSKSKVNLLTDQLRDDGLEILSEPRITGDGYFESVVSDPEGNRIEITE